MTHLIVMAVVVSDDRVLLCHRHPDREWYPDVWDLPGGHVEDNESEPAALRRELREELGIEATVSSAPLVGVSFDDVDAQVWRVDQWTGEIRNAAPNEHDEMRWFRLEEVAELPLAHPSIGELCATVVAAGDGPPTA